MNSEQAQEQDAKPEEEEITPTQEETTEASEDKGLSMLNIILYILGAIAVIAAGIYFFMRREPEQSAADIARSQSQESTPEPQEEQQLKRKLIQNQNLNLKQNNRFKKKHKQKLQKQKKILLQKIQTISHQIMMMKTIIDNQ